MRKYLACIIALLTPLRAYAEEIIGGADEATSIVVEGNGTHTALIVELIVLAGVLAIWLYCRRKDKHK